MTKLDLQKSLLDLEGKEMDDKVTLAKLLASRLFGSAKGDPIKYYDWAISLYTDGIIEVDKTDLEHLIEFVKNNDTMLVGWKAQIIKVLKA